MPPPLCNKCRGQAAQEGDTWCYGCSGWEALGRELTGHWDSQGARLIANDLVVNACRQVRALRSLGAGLARQGVISRDAGLAGASKRDRSETRADRRASLPRRKPESLKEEEVSAPEDAEESEEEEEEPKRRRERTPDPPVKERRSHHRPPEPEGSPPPPGTKSLPKSLGRGNYQEEHRTEHRSGHREHSDRDRRSGKKPSRRGGRKHQKLARLATDPLLPVHRKLSGAFLELSTAQPGALSIGCLGH